MTSSSLREEDKQKSARTFNKNLNEKIEQWENIDQDFSPSKWEVQKKVEGIGKWEMWGGKN